MSSGTRALAREATLSAAGAASLATILVLYGPPGSDLAAHAYQRGLFVQNGFELWNNFWYAGRYSFVTYSLLYYPAAALVGIRLLAVATVAAAAVAFAALLWREWGPRTRWSSRTFAVVWAGIVLSAAFPFVLGAALALLALWALQVHARWLFAGLAALTLAASPLAFLLLALVVGGIGISRNGSPQQLRIVAATLLGGCGVELALWRVFPESGRFPFSLAEFVPVCVFCGLGVALTSRVEHARVLRFIFVVYFAACAVAFAIPFALGENVLRLRFLSLPLAVLAVTLRSWRPRAVCFAALALAFSWNLSPLVGSWRMGQLDPTAAAAFWQPSVAYLAAHLTPSYRVEAVDTTGHWAAFYLPRAGIPLARGWYRQLDFPQNELLYDRLDARSYRTWLRSLGVRYVVLTGAPADYSARAEKALLLNGRSGLRPVLRNMGTTIFELPHPRSIVTGPGRSRVLALTRTELVVRLSRPGSYRVALRFSPYWRASGACVERAVGDMTRLVVRRAGSIRMRFALAPGPALEALAGEPERRCRP